MVDRNIKIFVENFTIVFLLIITLTLLLILVSILISDDDSSALTVLGGIGNLTSGVGAILTAAAALSGVATWKKQITYGKYIEFIWKSKIACQNVESNWMAYFVASATPRPTTTEPRLIEAYERTISTAPNSRKNTEHYLVELVQACQYLDSLVTKTDLNWTIRANRLRHGFLGLANEFDSSNPDENAQKTDQSSKIFEMLSSIKNDLEQLEAQYL